jgi:DNA-binding response OmpR family regulator
MRLLLVEDGPEIAAPLIARLKAEGFVVDHCANLRHAIEAVLSAEYRAVLLDRRLPDGDGLDLLPVLRTRAKPAPAIVLTAMDDVPDRIAGLDAGAEDYLVKPFSVDELLARLRVMLRRDYPEAEKTLPLKLGRLEYDLSTREARVGETPLFLPRRELAILDVLIRRAGRIVSREQIEGQVYGFDDEVSSNALEVHVSRLRKRLADARAGVILHAVRGIGYLLRPAP